MAKLNDFIAQVKKGMIRSNRYEVVIPLPAGSTGDTRVLALLCDSVNLPGINIASTPAMVYGESREMPYNRTFEPITMTFYCDNQMRVKKIIETWMNMIIDPTKRTIKYYNDYVKDIELYVQTPDEQTPYMVKLFECYPKSVQAIQMDATNKDLMKLSVTFQYKYWSSQQTAIGDSFENTARFADPVGVLTNTGVPNDSGYSSVPGYVGLPNEFGHKAASPAVVNRAIHLSKSVITVDA